MLSVLFVSAAVNASELKYWVSEHFSEAPDIFELSAKDTAENNPTVLELGDIDWSYDFDGDVRLCFDNRSLMQTHVGSKISNPVWRNRCRTHKFRLMDRNKSPEIDYKKQVTEGLLVYRADDGVLTCEAIFTIASMYSVLHSISEGEPLYENNQLHVYPYFRAYSDPFHGFPAIEKYLDSRDTFEHIEYTYDGYKTSLKHSISCLLPAFRSYWDKVREKCLHAVKGDNIEKIEEIYFPILKLTESHFREIAQKCRKYN